MWNRNAESLVNNMTGRLPPDETLDYFLGLMLRAPFRLARDVLPHMHPARRSST